MRFVLAALGAFWVSAASAGAGAPALTAFASGDFTAAAAAGEASGTSAGRTLAARALIAWCATDAAPAEIDDAIARAETNARAALALDPASVEARLQLALALGAKSRRMSTVAALRSGYAKEGRRLIDEALAAAPDEAWAHALSGAWHFEVIRRGGGVGARMFGASQTAGEAAFAQALTRAPDDPALRMQYAVALLGVDPERHAGAAGAQLARAVEAPAKDAFARRIRIEAARLKAVLEAQGPKAALAAAPRL